MPLCVESIQNCALTPPGAQDIQRFGDDERFGVGTLPNIDRVSG